MSSPHETGFAVRDEGCKRDPQGRCACMQKAIPRSKRSSKTSSTSQEETANTNANDDLARLCKQAMDELADESDASKALTDESVFDGWPALLCGREKEIAERLMSAVEDGDTHKVDDVLDEYCAAFPEKAMAILNVRKTNQRSEFPLAIAASLNDVSTMQLLISRGCCLRCQTASNESALHFAAITGSLDAVELLLDKGLTEFLFVPSSSAGDLLVDQVLDELTDCVQSNDSDAVFGLEAVALRILDAGPHCARETAERVSAVAWDSICADLQESLADVVARYVEDEDTSPADDVQCDLECKSSEEYVDTSVAAIQEEKHGNDGKDKRVGKDESNDDLPPGLGATDGNDAKLRVRIPTGNIGGSSVSAASQRSVSPRKRYNGQHHKLVSPKRDAEAEREPATIESGAVPTPTLIASPSRPHHSSVHSLPAISK